MGTASLDLFLLNLLSYCYYFLLLNLLTMRHFLLLALLCGIGLTMATPREMSQKLSLKTKLMEHGLRLKDLTKLGCSIDELLACAGEIQAALDDCSHLTDTSSIVTCINDILGATDCEKCVCDVLPFLCGQDKKINLSILL